MNCCRASGQRRLARVWVVHARRRGHPPEQRWRRDREAADQAVAVVLAASGFRRDACAISRSHTLGVAVAVAAPAGVPVGADLVAVDRVGARHAAAVTVGDEWKVLESSRICPPGARVGGEGGRGKGHW